MNAYTYHLSITCPKCGGNLEHVTSGRPELGETSAVAACLKCRREIFIGVRVVMREAPLSEHGTVRGYHQHKHRGEDACDECRAAQRDAMADYKRQRRLVGA